MEPCDGCPFTGCDTRLAWHSEIDKAPAAVVARSDQLKILGNGVVPPQCAAAVRAYIEDETRDAA